MRIEVKNIYHTDTLDPSEERFEDLLKGAGARLERIVSFGHPTPDGDWYDQTDTEWVMLLEGEATLVFDHDEPITLRRGDYLTLPPHLRHRVAAVSHDAIWLCLFVEQMAND